MSIYEPGSIPHRIRLLLRDLRTEHLHNGGSVETTPDYIRDSGIWVSGFVITVSDELESFSILKYGT